MGTFHIKGKSAARQRLSARLRQVVAQDHRRPVAEGDAFCGGFLIGIGLTAEFPLGVFRDFRTFLQVGRLLIADAPGRNHAVFEVTMLQRMPELKIRDPMPHEAFSVWGYFCFK